MSYTIKLSTQQIRHITKALTYLAQHEHQTEQDECDNNVNLTLILSCYDTLTQPEDNTVHGFCV